MKEKTDFVMTLVPLLLLIAVELATVGRDALLTDEIDEHPPMLFPFLKGLFPPLGRFNFVHGINLTIMATGMFLINLLSDGWVRWGLSFLTWVMLVVQPVLEVDEYRAILSDGESGLPFDNVYSHHLHIVLVTAMSGYLYRFGDGVPDNPYRGLEHPVEIAPFFSVFLLLIGASYLGFTWALYAELKSVNGSSDENQDSA